MTTPDESFPPDLTKKSSAPPTTEFPPTTDFPTVGSFPVEGVAQPPVYPPALPPNPPPYPGAGYGPAGYGFPGSAGAGYGVPGYGAPGYGAHPFDAPYGRDPRTGEPYSDKSRIVAGLLQIFLGGFGVGRFYIGSNGVAVAQLILLIVGWLSVFVVIGFVILFALGIWVLIDGVMMLVGSVRDGQGRLLRP